MKGVIAERDSTEVCMRKMASRRARRLWEKTDHWQMRKDLEQEGWLAYLKCPNAYEGVRWLNVKRAMNDYWCKWLFQYQYKQAKIENFSRPLPYGYGLDVEPLFRLSRQEDRQKGRLAYDRSALDSSSPQNESL